MRRAGGFLRRMCVVMASVLLFLPTKLGAEETPHDADAAEIRADVISLANQWLSAWNERDMDQMMSIHEPSLIYYWRGRPRGYATFMDELREFVFPEPASSEDMVELVDPQVQVLSPDISVIGFQMRGTQDADDMEPGAAVSLVVVRRDDVWRVAHIHESPVR